MSRSIRSIACLLASFVALGLTACATSKEWSITGGDRTDGLVRVSYEYPEFHQPSLSDAQAALIATRRCNGWGYERAHALAGQLRQCSNMDGANCDLWRVTREYQCEGQGQGASESIADAKGAIATRLAR